MFWLGSGHCCIIYWPIRSHFWAEWVPEGASLVCNALILFIFPHSPWYCSKDSLVHLKVVMLEYDYCSCLLLFISSLHCFPPLVFDMFLS